MTRQRNVRKTAADGDRGPDGRFRKGNAASPGRPPGSPNRRTLAGRALLKALEAGDEGQGLPSGFDRLKKLLTDADPRVRLGAERLVLSLLHGRSVAGDDSAGGEDFSAVDRPGLGLRLANSILGDLLRRDPAALDDARDPEAAESGGPLEKPDATRL